MAISKVNTVVKANISKWDDVTFSGLNKVSGANIEEPGPPAGLIVPYTAGAGGAPSGWSIYNTADGNMIVGAGDAYAVNDNGGDGAVTKATVNSGTHWFGSTVGNTAGGSGNSQGGAHSHNYTFTYTPPYQDCYLIKADSDQSNFPAGCVIFLEASHGSLTNIWTSGYMFRANAGTSTGGSNSITGLSSTSSGGHVHGSTYCAPSGGAARLGLFSAGGHTHTSTTVSMTNTLYQYALAAYQDAVSTFNLESSMIAMYENTTPPDGWSLCDGTGGTPDLRNWFVKCVAAASAGSTSGNGTVTAQITGSLTHGTHDHDDELPRAPTPSQTAAHTIQLAHAAHSSPAMNQNYSWRPNYWALAFIKKD
jgi:hypothetical protein